MDKENEKSSNKIIVGGCRLGPVMTNFYYLHREKSAETIAIDPADHGDLLCRKLTEKGLKITAILLTHGHFDHISGVRAMKDACGAPVYASVLEERVCGDAYLNESQIYTSPVTVRPDVWLHDGQKITLAGITLLMLSTPGHTEGSCCYYIEDGHILFSGDTLFCESYGRTDNPTGSESAIVHSIWEKLFVLPDDTVVYPGHEGITTIGHEKQYNMINYQQDF